MTENLSADSVQSRQAGFVRCCLKVKERTFVGDSFAQEYFWQIVVLVNVSGSNEAVILQIIVESLHKFVNISFALAEQQGSDNIVYQFSAEIIGKSNCFSGFGDNIFALGIAVHRNADIAFGISGDGAAHGEIKRPVLVIEVIGIVELFLRSPSSLPTVVFLFLLISEYLTNSICGAKKLRIF